MLEILRNLVLRRKLSCRSLASSEGKESSEKSSISDPAEREGAAVHVYLKALCELAQPAWLEFLSISYGPWDYAGLELEDSLDSMKSSLFP